MSEPVWTGEAIKAVRNDLDAREHGRHLQRRFFGDGNAGNGAAVAAVDQVGNLLVGELLG